MTHSQSKTEFMLIGSGQKLNTLQLAPSLAINGHPVSQGSQTKSLGVNLTIICLGMRTLMI